MFTFGCTWREIGEIVPFLCLIQELILEMRQVVFLLVIYAFK